MSQTSTLLTTTGSPAVAPGTRRGRVAGILLPIVGLVVAVAAWWMLTVLFDVKTVILPRPDEVYEAFVQLPGYLLEQSWVTLRSILVGYLLSVAAGVIIGLAIAVSNVVERMVSPLLVAINAIPKIALGPMLVAWLGFGTKPILMMIFLVCFFPIVLSTATGLTSTPTELAEMIRSMDASRRQVFLKVRFPAALPQIFVGLKVAMPLAAIGAVVGEFLPGAEAGLGFVIQQSSGIADTPTAMAAIVLISLLSILLYYAVLAVEHLALPWVRETTSQR